MLVLLKVLPTPNIETSTSETTEIHEIGFKLYGILKNKDSLFSFSFLSLWGALGLHFQAFPYNDDG